MTTLTKLLLSLLLLAPSAWVLIQARRQLLAYKKLGKDRIPDEHDRKMIGLFARVDYYASATIILAQILALGFQLLSSQQIRDYLGRDTTRLLRDSGYTLLSFILCCMSLCTAIISRYIKEQNHAAILDKMVVENESKVTKESNLSGD